MVLYDQLLYTVGVNKPDERNTHIFQPIKKARPKITKDRNVKETPTTATGKSDRGTEKETERTGGKHSENTDTKAEGADSIRAQSSAGATRTLGRRKTPGRKKSSGRSPAGETSGGATRATESSAPTPDSGAETLDVDQAEETRRSGPWKWLSTHKTGSKSKYV
ncbi:hypothetical protein COOONC_07435 [Cooperia oncophora]